MVVLSNHRVGPAAEVLVSPEVAAAILRATAEAAQAHAGGLWEHELARWLEGRAHALGAAADTSLDTGDFAWSPEHFESQKAFVLRAIERAAAGSPHARALGLWARLIGAHRRELVAVGRRWRGAVPSVTA